MNKSKPIPHYLIASFLAAAKAETFLEAAKQLGLTQSALSRQMQLLEELLPEKVFTLVGRKKELTAYGITLERLLAPQFAQTEGLIQQASLFHADVKNAKVKIAGRGEILDLIAENLNFKGHVHFLSLNGGEVLQSVLNRQCDIGIVHESYDSSEIIMKSLFSNRLRIVVPKKLLPQRPKSTVELAKKLSLLPVLLYKEEDRVTNNFLAQFNLSIEQLSIHRIYAHYSSLAQMISKGHGWGILPSTVTLKEEQFHFFSLSGRSLDERNYFLCYRKEFKDAPWFKALVEELKETFKLC